MKLTNRTGFTLIEILVVLSLFGIIMMTLTTVMISIIKESNRSLVLNEVRQNAEKIMANIGSEVRSAGCMQFTRSAGVNTLSIFTDKSCSNLKVSYISGPGPSYTFNKANPATQNLISSNVVVVNCGSGPNSCGNAPCINGFDVVQADGSLIPDGGTTGSVKVTLSVQQTPKADLRNDFCGFVSLTNTFTPRN